MGIGASIFLIVVGAILTFAVTADVSGIDIATVGWILMIVGAIGLVMTAFIRQDPYNRPPPYLAATPILPLPGAASGPPLPPRASGAVVEDPALHAARDDDHLARDVA